MSKDRPASKCGRNVAAMKRAGEVWGCGEMKHMEDRC